MTIPPPKRIGRRHRRLRRTLLALGSGVVILGVVGAWIYFASRPDVRRPGESLEDITSRLSKDLPAEAPRPRLIDVTEAAGLAGFRSWAGGERTSQLPEDMGAGAAWGDVDNDGDDDLVLVGAGGPLTVELERRAESVLYENLIDTGEAVFRRSSSLPETRIQGMAAAWGDADGDGWQDLVLTGYNALRFFRNERGKLVPHPALPDLAGYWAGATWGDFDGDGDLDLYVCGYVQYVEDSGERRQVSEQYGAAVPYTLNPASYEPERNLLFENRSRPGSEIAFEEVAALWGVSNPEGRSLSAIWHDFDADGRLDLYIANDISDNALYLNRGETFEDAGLTAWVADYRGAMGLATGDWNRDGDDDLFVTHWVAQENALYDSRLADLPPSDDGRSRPLAFSDMAAPLGLGQPALPFVGWGTEFVDLDGDGWLDLLVANGSTLEAGASGEPKRLKPQRAMLLWSESGQHFHDLAPYSEPLALPRVARGLATSDFDLDGDVDVVVTALDGPPLLLANEMQSGHWLELRLNGRSGGTGRGSTALVRLGDVELRRTVGGASYLSQSSRALHFGLGTAERADEVRVEWKGGETESFGPLAGNAIWELTQGEPPARRLEPRSAAASEAVLNEIPADERARRLAFWAKQRAGMEALKKAQDCEAAIGFFREALALDPGHQDSHYYLANCLMETGKAEEALAELEALRQADPKSHRGQKQWGILRAITAESDADLAAAESALEQAHQINREETGALQLLGEIALVRGDRELARQRLEWVCQTNVRAVGAFYLRAYVAWRQGDAAAARRLLEEAQAARGPEWKPEGAVAEGDVRVRMHREGSLLAQTWEGWDGEAADLARVFAPLERQLEVLRPSAA